MKNTPPVEFHYSHHTEEGVGAAGFLVVVPDAALVELNKGHTFRGLTTVFNTGGRPSDRLRALADALREAEDMANPKGGTMADPGWRRRAIRWAVGVVYNRTRWMRRAKK